MGSVRSRRTSGRAHPALNPSPPSSPASPATPGEGAADGRERHYVRHVILVAVIMFGLVVTESLSNNILPLTLRHFTADAFIIGLILALNPLFGFVAQPIVGYWSDRTWTRFGRRGTFLVLVAPMLACCLVAVPASRDFLHVVLLVVVWQFLHDVLFGADHPLVGDLIPIRKRPFAASLMLIASQAAAFVVVAIGFPLAERHEQATPGGSFGAPVYWIAAVALVGCVMVPGLLLREERRVRAPGDRFEWRAYLRDFTGNRTLVGLAGVNCLRAVQQAGLIAFQTLFAFETLRLSKTEYGMVAGLLPLLTIASAITLGFVIKPRGRARWMAGGACLAIGAGVLGWRSEGLLELFAAQVLFQLAHVVTEISFRSMLADAIPREKLGQLASGMSIFYGGGRIIGTMLVGKIISLGGNDYRLVWPCSIVASTAYLICALFLVPDPGDGQPGEGDPRTG